MDYTKKEISHIKKLSFYKGFKNGLLTGVCIFMTVILVACFLI